MLKNLLEKRAALLARCDEIAQAATAANREMTEVEQTEFRSKLDEAKALNPKIKELEDLAEQKRESDAANQRAAAQPAQQRPNTGGTGATVHDNREDAPFNCLGEFLQTVRGAAEDRSAMDPRLRKADVLNMQVRAAAGMNETVATEGGFLVGQDFATDLSKLIAQESQVWSRASDVPLSGNSNGLTVKTIDETSRANGSRWGGVAVYMADEADSFTASKPKFGESKFSLKKVLGLCYATDELLADASALQSVISAAFSEEFAFKKDDLGIRGVGAGQPVGILNANCTVTVSKESTQANGTILYQNVSKMRTRMLPRSFGRAVWFINQDCQTQLEQMFIPHTNKAGTENVSGQSVYMPPGGATAQPYGTLFGRPVIPIEQCESLGTKGDIILADMGMYQTISKGGVQGAVSMHVKFLTDEMAFRWVLRLDGQPKLKSAITPYKGNATLSSFVVLENR